MLKQRVITGLILAALFLGVIFGLYTAQVRWVFALVVVLGAYEWARLAGFSRRPIRIAYSVLMFICMYFSYSVFVPAYGLQPIFIIASMFWLFALIWIVTYQTQVRVIRLNAVFKLLMGLFVLIPAWFALVFLHSQSLNNEARGVLLFIILLAVALADVGAYFAGRAFGKHKLASKVSPGKTWEGLLGGVLTSIIVLLIAAYSLQLNSRLLILFVISGAVATLISIPGDLLESLLKREAGVKDSGTLLPGHGGILDRIDSITAAAPVFACLYCLWAPLI
ncbi:MAG: phosphatidate cytidylyltransferase [Gammaproteobacteria bacterium]|nr:phosphatidate cytidylyltransferase [Gammaproteobacteria bacterium]